MDAVILAGGAGLRLWPLTQTCPKPLVRVAGVPMLHILLQQLAYAGFDTATLCTHHGAEPIRESVGDGARFGIDVRFCHSDRPLGTAGPLAELAGDLLEPFLVVNADVLADLDFAAVMDAHHASGGVATVVVREHRTPIDFGVVQVDPRGRITSYAEKPTLKSLISCGVYALSPVALRHLARGVAADMPALIATLAANDEAVHAFSFDGAWFDVGTPDQLRAAEGAFGRDDAQFLRPGGREERLLP